MLASTLTLSLLILTHPAWAWSNGGYSADANNPDYGTHDWIAERALEWIPANEKALILTYRASYLYGTELPDNNQAADGIGDTTLHHVYFFANGSVQDDSAARRARDMQDQAAAALLVQDYALTAKWTGAMTHYIADQAVFGHVMGSATEWGSEQHHSDYEDYVNTRTDTPGEATIQVSFDGVLATTSAYDVALSLGRDTTFDLSGAGRTAVWMHQHYNWSDPTFLARAYESINLAVNYVAEAVHAVWSTVAVTTTTTFQQTTTTSSLANPVLDFRAAGSDATGDTIEISSEGGDLVYAGDRIHLVPWHSLYWSDQHFWVFGLVNVTQADFYVGYLYLYNDTSSSFSLWLFHYADGSWRLRYFNGEQFVGTTIVLCPTLHVPGLSIQAAARFSNRLFASGGDLQIQSDQGTYENRKVYSLLNLYNVTGSQNGWNELWVLQTEGNNYYFGIFYMWNNDRSRVTYAYELRLSDLTTRYTVESVMIAATWWLAPSVTVTTTQQPTTTSTTSSSSHVVINEVEQNPLGDDSNHEWLVLYNPTEATVDITGWRIQTTHGRSETYAIPAGIVLPAGGSWNVTFPGQIIDNEDESLVLLNAQGQVIDSTPTLTDTADDSNTWQRSPDGSDNWIYTPEFPWPMIFMIGPLTLVLITMQRTREVKARRRSDAAAPVIVTRLTTRGC